MVSSRINCAANWRFFVIILPYASVGMLYFNKLQVQSCEPIRYKTKAKRNVLCLLSHQIVLTGQTHVQNRKEGITKLKAHTKHNKNSLRVI